MILNQLRMIGMPGRQRNDLTPGEKTLITGDTHAQFRCYLFHQRNTASAVEVLQYYSFGGLVQPEQEPYDTEACS